VIRIKHYLFETYKIGGPPKTKKRNLPPELLLKIKNCIVPPDSRAEMARDLFMANLYLCGMNAVDFYYLEDYDASCEHIEYNRSKTKGIRNDEAFISVKNILEVSSCLANTYASCKHVIVPNGLDTALSLGMKEIRKLTGIPDITFYWSRHTFATIARNKCRISKDDIAEALNHVDGDHKVTDIYLEKDWSVVDEVQVAVINYLDKLERDGQPSTVTAAEPTAATILEQKRQTMRLGSPVKFPK
jgi:hypothetical protein